MPMAESPAKQCKLLQCVTSRLQLNCIEASTMSNVPEVIGQIENHRLDAKQRDA